MSGEINSTRSFFLLTGVPSGYIVGSVRVSDPITGEIEQGDIMETTINKSYLEGKCGRIFIARKGGIMVFLLENGESWFTNCNAPSSTITSGPVPDYWIHSIDWSGNFSDYFTFLMEHDTENKPHYPAYPQADSLTPERITKLKANATRRREQNQ